MAPWVQYGSNSGWANERAPRHIPVVNRRSYGTGTLYARRDGNGRETWYGSWRVGGTARQAPDRP